MAVIVTSIEIDRPAQDVFSYATDPTRFHEWQKGVVDGRTEGDKCITTRRIGFAERPVTSQITNVDPPRAWTVHGLDGPIRATVNVRVEPLDGDSSSRLTIDLDFEGHGIGKVLVPLLVRREAEKAVPENLQRLKANLEAAAGPQ